MFHHYLGTVTSTVDLAVNEVNLCSSTRMSGLTFLIAPAGFGLLTHFALEFCSLLDRSGLLRLLQSIIAIRTTGMASKRAAQSGKKSNKRRKQAIDSHAAIPAAKPDRRNKKLLDLPPELRTAIYEYALIQTEEITIAASLGPPALLSVNRLIRTEASGLWYNSNTFAVEVKDCEASVLLAFDQHLREVGQDKMIYQIITPRTNRGNWANLREWSRAVWKWETRPYPKHEDRDRYEAVYYGAHDIAVRHQDRSWEVCESALESFKFVVATFDWTWE